MKEKKTLSIYFVVDLKGHSCAILKQIHLLTIGKMLKNLENCL